MREIRKSEKLNGVSYDVRGPVLDAAMKLEAEGEKILKLNVGNPGAFAFNAPDSVLHAVSDNIIRSQGYSDSKGQIDGREAIAAYAKEKGIEGVRVEDVYTGNGVSELIMTCMQALLNPGDEILIPAPDYPLWTGAAKLAGGTPVHYICDESSDWMPDMADMRSKVTAKTKAIVIINPNNPTGAIYGVDILQQIVDLAREHDLIIFSDEIYDRLLMDGLTHTSIASLAPDLFVVTMNGLSKSHMIAGFRIGWMCLSGNKAIAQDYIAGLNLLSSMRLCSNVPAQSVITAALNDRKETVAYCQPGGRLYEQRKAVVEGVKAIDGMSMVTPRAAFYSFPKLDAKRFNITDDEKFALDFLREKHVLIVNGRGFNWPTPDHFRIVYLPQAELLTEAMLRLKEFLADYRQA